MRQDKHTWYVAWLKNNKQVAGTTRPAIETKGFDTLNELCAFIAGNWLTRLGANGIVVSDFEHGDLYCGMEAVYELNRRLETERIARETKEYTNAEKKKQRARSGYAAEGASV